MKRFLVIGLTLTLSLFLACGNDDPAEPADSTAPAMVDDLSATDIGANRLSLIWTAPGDDGNNGRASRYELRVSDAVITPHNWEDAEPVEGLPDPAVAGSQENFTILDLEMETSYHYALLALDEEGNAGDVSNDLAVTTLGPPVIVSAVPAQGSEDVSMLTEFAFTFDRPMDPSTFTDETIQLLAREFGKTLRPSLDLRAVYVLPQEPLPPQINIGIRFNAGILDQDGLPFAGQSFDFDTGPYDCTGLGDRFEPNNDFMAAPEIEIDIVQPLLSTCGDDIDIYRFSLEEPKKITAFTNIDLVLPEQEEGTYLEWRFEWFRDDGESYSWSSGSANPDSPGQFRFSFNPGTYYLQLSSSDDEELILYDLEFRSSEACADDQYEDNDFREDAVAIEPGLHEGLRACYLDEDWFTMPVVAGQTFVMSVDSGDHIGSKRIYAQEPGGTSFYTNNYGDSFVTDTLEITADGNLVFFYKAWADDVTYDMQLDLN